MEAASADLISLCDLATEPTTRLLQSYFDSCRTFQFPVVGVDRSSRLRVKTTQDESNLARNALQALALLSSRSGEDKEARRLVQQELEPGIAAEDAALRARHGLGKRELVVASYRCMDAQARAGCLVLTSTHICFDPVAQNPHGGAAGGGSERHKSAGKRDGLWHAALHEVVLLEKVESKMTSLLENPLRLELRSYVKYHMPARSIRCN